MNDKKILILDIETTNFLDKGGSIVEIGIVELCLASGQIATVFDSLLREAMLTAKHRQEPFGWIFKNSDLTVEAVRGAPPAEKVFPAVQDVIDAYPLGVTAYNKNFDFNFLRSRGIEIKKELPCPMLLSTNICRLQGRRPGSFKWPKVEEAFAHFFPEKDYTEKHRGADDALHEAMIVRELWERGIFEVEGFSK